MIRRSTKTKKTKKTNWALKDSTSLTAFFSVNKRLSRLFGPEKAVFIANLVDKSNYFEERNMLKDGWFFQTHEQQINETGIKEYGIKSGKQFFKKLGVLEIKKKGLPAKEHYRIDFSELYEIIEKSNVGQDRPNSSGQGHKKPIGLVPMDSCDHKDNIYKDNKVKKNKSFGHLDDFEKWYKSYPKKVAKQAAKKAWIKIQKLPKKERPSFDTLLSAVKEQSQSDQWKDKQYIPNPSTWLNQGRWDDEIIVPKNNNKNNNSSIHDEDDPDDIEYQRLCDPTSPYYGTYDPDEEAPKWKPKYNPQNPTNHPDLPGYQMSPDELIYEKEFYDPFSDDDD